MNPDDTLPKRFRDVSRCCAEESAFYYKNTRDTFQEMSYREMWEAITNLAAGFHCLGVSRGDHVGIISDNRKEWMMCDIALLSIGAVDTPRGSDSTADEMAYILGHVDCSLAIAENMLQAEKILSKAGSLPLLKRIVVFDMPEPPGDIKNDSSIEITGYADALSLGKKYLRSDPQFVDREIDKGTAEDLATIIYTSGTTGEPKGVMLPHRSFIFQIENVHEHIDLQQGYILMSVLPIWHAFERAVEYYVFARGCSIAYSKPVGKVLFEDFAAVKPQWLPSVPRIWENLRRAIYQNINSGGKTKKAIFTFFVGVGGCYSFFKAMFQGRLPQFRPRSRPADICLAVLPLIFLTPLKALGDLLVFNAIKARLGGRFIAGVSGGGSLPSAVDHFFQAVGILLVEGYGLTETGPILAVRKKYHPVPGTIGPLLKGIEYRVIDENGNVLGPNEKGVLYVKTPQIMLGYYKRPEETEKVLQKGWLNTGDLAIFTYRGECKIMGRAKETIVLLGGENVEPAPLEETLCQSDYIEQVMVVGQDQKFLGALIVPNMEKLKAAAAEKGISYVEAEELPDNPAIQEQIHNEIQKLIHPRKGFKGYERIFRFKLLARKFEVGRELTHSLKIRRNVVYELYAKEIAGIFS
jgi:long-chain acyl-CoA synthetase